MFTKDCFLKIWRRERVIARLIAAWASAVGALLVSTSGDYFKLSYLQDTSLLSLLLLTALFFLLQSTVAWLLDGYPTDSWFLFGAVTLCVWHWLGNATQEPARMLVWLAVWAVYTLFVLWVVRENLPLLAAWKPKRRTVILLAALFSTLVFAVLVIIGVLRYKVFYTPNYDFGLFVNMFHNMKETGLPMVTSERNKLLSHFAVHISPIYYLLLPFYAIFPSPVTLQVGQAAALMLGVIPVYLLAKHFGLTSRAQIAVSALYCFYPVLSTGCFYDLHENCFLPLFLLLTFYFYESKRPIPMYLSALAVLMVKEDAAIYLIVFAVYLLLSEKNYLHGFLLLVLSGGWFALAGHLLTTYGEGMMINRFDNLIFDREDGLLGAVKTALLNPGFLLTQLFTDIGGGWAKVLYSLQMFLPLGFLPFCTKRVGRWILVSPILINLLTHYVYQYDIGFQYHFGIAAFLIYTMLKNLPTISPNVGRRLLTVALCASLTLYALAVLPLAGSYHKLWQESKTDYRNMAAALDTIPEDASVNASSFLVAYLADRAEIYEVDYHGNETDVDYVALDIRWGGWESAYASYTASGYRVVLEEKGLVLILKK